MNKFALLSLCTIACANAIMSSAIGMWSPYDNPEDRGRSTPRPSMGNDIRDPYTGKMVNGPRESEIIRAISAGRPVPPPSSQSKVKK